MVYSIGHVGQALRSARQQRKLSQRMVSAKVGITQAQISRIESGSVDLRLSTLVELSRVLDLELVLVPRKLVPAVRSLTRGPARSAPAYAIDRDESDG